MRHTLAVNLADGDSVPLIVVVFTSIVGARWRGVQSTWGSEAAFPVHYALAAGAGADHNASLCPNALRPRCSTLNAPIAEANGKPCRSRLALLRQLQRDALTRTHAA